MITAKIQFVGVEKFQEFLCTYCEALGLYGNIGKTSEKHSYKTSILNGKIIAIDRICWVEFFYADGKLVNFYDEEEVNKYLENEINLIENREEK